VIKSSAFHLHTLTFVSLWNSNEKPKWKSSLKCGTLGPLWQSLAGYRMKCRWSLGRTWCRFHKGRRPTVRQLTSYNSELPCHSLGTPSPDWTQSITFEACVGLKNYESTQTCGSKNHFKYGEQVCRCFFRHLRYLKCTKLFQISGVMF